MKFPQWLKVYGDLNYRDKNCPNESAEQMTFFNYVRKHPTICNIAIHPRNEGKRTYNQVSRQKAEGMTPGAADIIIPGNPSFVCELKRKDHTKSTWQKNQILFLESCANMESFVCVALGHEAAIEAFNDWYELAVMKNEQKRQVYTTK